MLECYASICMSRELTAGDVLCSAMSTIFFILFKLPKGWLNAKSLLRSSSNLSSLEINVLCHHQYLHEKSLFSLYLSLFLYSLQRKENRITQQNIAGKMNEEEKNYVICDGNCKSAWFLFECQCYAKILYAFFTINRNM